MQDKKFDLNHYYHNQNDNERNYLFLQEDPLNVYLFSNNDNEYKIILFIFITLIIQTSINNIEFLYNKIVELLDIWNIFQHLIVSILFLLLFLFFFLFFFFYVVFRLVV